MNNQIHKLTGKLIISTTLLLLSSAAHSDTIGVGIARAPEFSGSDEYHVIPLASFELETPYGILKNNRVGAQFDLIKDTSFDTGPILRYNFGRDDEADDEIVSALPEIEASFEAGWFIGSGFKLSSLGLNTDAIVIGNLEAVTDIGDGHEGVLVSAALGLVMQVSEKLRLVPSINFEYGNDDYANSFYGVSAASAAQFGLSEFTASAGLQSTQLALVAIRTIDEKWSLTGTLGYATLQGDAADSPITTERGTDEQIFTGLTVNYTF